MTKYDEKSTPSRRQIIKGAGTLAIGISTPAFANIRVAEGRRSSVGAGTKEIGIRDVLNQAGIKKC